MLKNVFKSAVSCARLSFPAFLDTSVYSCSATQRYAARIISVAVIRWQSTSLKTDPEGLSENDVVNPKFTNRNPRNLEGMLVGRKRLGWRFQYPSPRFYHRLVLDSSGNHTKAYVEHSNGKRVILASTREIAIRKFLHSASDVAAAENIGRVIAERCKMCGITSMTLLQSHNPLGGKASEKFQAFHQAVIDGGITLEEGDVFEPAYEPGIDYEDEDAINDLKQRQRRVRTERGAVGEQRKFEKEARKRSKTTHLRYKNINRNRGYTTHGRLLGFHMIHHRYMK